MRLLGNDFSGTRLLARLERRLEARGLAEPDSRPIRLDGAEPRVDPLSFNLSALEEHADPTRPLPLHTHRSGAGRLVLYAKWAFRKSCQVFINEAFARQHLFNSHVRDSYAQLSAELMRLREKLEAAERKKPRRRGAT